MPQQALATFYFCNTYTGLSDLIMAYFGPIWSGSLLTGIIPDRTFTATTNSHFSECM